jgi:hypothetical protein
MPRKVNVSEKTGFRRSALRVSPTYVGWRGPWNIETVIIILGRGRVPYSTRASQCGA